MNTNQRPGFARRFWQALIRLLAIAVALAILAALGIGGYFGYQELQRSFATVQAQMNAMDSKVNLLRSDVNTLMAKDDPQQLSQMASINADMSRLDIRVSNLETALANGAATRQAALDELTTELETAVTTGETLTSDVSTLNAALTALQSDINENVSQVDALGGQIDQVQSGITLLDEQQAALLAAVEQNDQLTETQRLLVLFRLWELISRARFRLLENNAGLAAGDVEAAIRTVDLLVALQPETESLQLVQARLLLAFGNLPDAPDLAATDLETAWDELDALFEEQVVAQLETAVPPADLTVSGGEEVTVTPTATPTVAATPAAAVTPAPTSTP